MSLTRRQFIKTSAAATAAISVPVVASSRVLGANDEIRVGLVGTGGRGTGAHLPGFEGQKGVTVVAVCDADHGRMARAAEIIESKYHHKARQYPDMRKMFERTDIDVIGNATQIYWHGLSTIWACQAGKHVYVEKPLSFFIWEGRQMVNAARKHNRIVQCGSQHRSLRAVREAIRWTREGHLGKIKYITCFACKPRGPIGKRDTPLPIPDSIDYDLWCGPAKKLPIYRNQLQYDCRYVWNTGVGESVDQGVHELDVARWWLGESRLPRRVMSMGGRFVFDDVGEVPNVHIMYYDFPTAPILHEMHNLSKAKGTSEKRTLHGIWVGLIVACEGGSIHVKPYEMTRTCVVYDPQGKEIRSFSGGENHFVNFIEAVRSGRREHLNADVEEGHISAATGHTANISYRLGKVATQKEQRSQVENIPALNEMYDRFLVHLKAHEIDPNTATLSPWLEIDREKECFKDHEKANEIVRGYYREPYVVPDLSGESAKELKP